MTRNNSNVNCGDPTPEQLDAALRAFRRGSAAEFDRLIADDHFDEPHVAATLLSMVEAFQHRPRRQSIRQTGTYSNNDD